MSIEQAIANREKTLIHSLLERQEGVDDRTGKGQASERIIEDQLLRPFLPPGFDCGKGAVVTAESPNHQSGAIDRVIFDKAAAPPLLHDEDHSIFPIEAVAGIVEITMRLDSTKLDDDIERMMPVKAMTTRRYLAPKTGSRTKVVPVEKEELSPRSFVVGLPADKNWAPRTIAQRLRQVQVNLGPPTHVHGLYVIGIGYFFTVAVEGNEAMYRIGGWTGPDRLFRFTDSFRHAFTRWSKPPALWSADLGIYVSGDSGILAE